MSDMKTLLERLKPEIKNNLLNSEIDYPTLVGDLKKILSDNVAITEMKFGDLTNLGNFCDNSPSSILEIYEMFND
jgi:hypothetical protein